MGDAERLDLSLAQVVGALDVDGGVAERLQRLSEEVAVDDAIVLIDQYRGDYAESADGRDEFVELAARMLPHPALGGFQLIDGDLCEGGRTLSLQSCRGLGALTNAHGVRVWLGHLGLREDVNPAIDVVHLLSEAPVRRLASFAAARNHSVPKCRSLSVGCSDPRILATIRRIEKIGAVHASTRPLRHPRCRRCGRSGLIDELGNVRCGGRGYPRDVSFTVSAP